MDEKNHSRRVVRTAVAVATLTAAGVLSFAPAHAVPITTALTGTNWSMTYDSAQVSNVLFTELTPIGFPTHKELFYTTTFNDLSPITITFKQTTPAATDNFGLRFTAGAIIDRSGLPADFFEPKVPEGYIIKLLEILPVRVTLEWPGLAGLFNDQVFHNGSRNQEAHQITR